MVFNEESMEESVVSDEESVEGLIEDSDVISTGTEDNSIEENIDDTEEEESVRSAGRRSIDGSTRKLFDLLVTCWNPDMMDKKNALVKTYIILWKQMISSR